ncbi:hypothetical protein DEJ23_10185 [Curtobacterium sp. MCSS17_008]|uniref:hypothetical protein n=1 Tax=Curtobacterium sp. MCSS17_008 TaxID=2175647 RepID=UPI000DA847EB|nr:hypothetical protein [Curtobacterium sp. MCSS17_008]PZF56526.1 hypothetical protein DEJ23_10185 [Curtobacterium sp. MCSS17_008]
MTERAADTAKRTQEQAVAAWVNHLNELRLDSLFDRLARHGDDLAAALKTVDAALRSIDLEVVARNRGGVKGMHGFIAEVAEVGVSNARARINGDERVYEWVNDNGPVDLLRQGVEIQQKFVAAGGRLGLGAIGEHLDRYPDFIRNGGKYQVPADHYARIRLLHDMPAADASRLVSGAGDGPSFKDWQRVQAFFGTGRASIDSLEPSRLEYADVQRGEYAATLEGEKDSLRETGRSQRAAASAAARASLSEGAKVTVAAGAVEGATTFVLAVVAKRRAGKPIAQFSPKDWVEVLEESGIGVVKGGVRGASVYTLTNLAAAPAAVASSLVTASFGIAELANEFRAGALTEVDFIERAEMVSLDAAVSTVSSLVGQALIPIPILGAVLGNTVGTVMYKTVADSLAQQEARLLEQYADEQRALGERLSREQALLVDEIRSATSTYVEVLDRAFEPEVEVALAGSIALAEHVGVSPSDILDSDEKSAAYFLD